MGSSFNNSSFFGEPIGSRTDSRRFMFAIELKAGSRTEFTWDPANAYEKFPEFADVSESEVIRHTLLLRRAIVGPTAKEGEENLITTVVADPDMTEKVTFPLVYLTKGKESQSTTDIMFPETVPVTFTLAQGTGPVHLVGYHFIERLTDLPSDGEEEAEEGEEDEDDEEIAESMEKAKAVMRMKRRIHNENGNGESSSAKKAKVQATRDDEEMDNEETPKENVS